MSMGRWSNRCFTIMVSNSFLCVVPIVFFSCLRLPSPGIFLRSLRWNQYTTAEQPSDKHRANGSETSISRGFYVASSIFLLFLICVHVESHFQTQRSMSPKPRSSMRSCNMLHLYMHGAPWCTISSKFKELAEIRH